MEGGQEQCPSNQSNHSSGPVPSSATAGLPAFLYFPSLQAIVPCGNINLQGAASSQQVLGTHDKSESRTNVNTCGEDKESGEKAPPKPSEVPVYDRELNGSVQKNDLAQPVSVNAGTSLANLGYTCMPYKVQTGITTKQETSVSSSLKTESKVPSVSTHKNFAADIHKWQEYGLKKASGIATCTSDDTDEKCEGNDKENGAKACSSPSKPTLVCKYDHDYDTDECVLKNNDNESSGKTSVGVGASLTKLNDMCKNYILPTAIKKEPTESSGEFGGNEVMSSESHVDMKFGETEMIQEVQESANKPCAEVLENSGSENTDFAPCIENCFSTKKLSLLEMMKRYKQCHDQPSIFMEGSENFCREQALYNAMASFHVSGPDGNLPVNFYYSLLSKDSSITFNEAFRLRHEIIEDIRLQKKLASKHFSSLDVNESIYDAVDPFTSRDSVMKKYARMKKQFNLKYMRSNTSEKTESNNGTGAEKGSETCYICCKYVQGDIISHIRYTHIDTGKREVPSVDVTPYLCTHCDIADTFDAININSLEDLVEHENEVHLGSPPCYFCGLTLHSLEENLEHVVNNHCIIYYCKVCKSNHYSDTEFTRHCVQMMHFKKNKSLCSMIPELLYFCPFCNIKFIQHESISRHINFKHYNGEKRVRNGVYCYSCQAIFIDEKALNFHTGPNAHRPGSAPVVNPEKLTKVWIKQAEMKAELARKRLEWKTSRRQQYSEVRKPENVSNEGNGVIKSVTVKGSVSEYSQEEMTETLGLTQFSSEFAFRVTQLLLYEVLTRYPYLLASDEMKGSHVERMQNLKIYSRSADFNKTLAKFGIHPLPWDEHLSKLCSLYREVKPSSAPKIFRNKFDSESILKPVGTDGQCPPVVSEIQGLDKMEHDKKHSPGHLKQDNNCDNQTKQPAQLQPNLSASIVGETGGGNTIIINNQQGGSNTIILGGGLNTFSVPVAITESVLDGHSSQSSQGCTVNKAADVYREIQPQKVKENAKILPLSVILPMPGQRNKESDQPGMCYTSKPSVHERAKKPTLDILRKKEKGKHMRTFFLSGEINKMVPIAPMPLPETSGSKTKSSTDNKAKKGKEPLKEEDHPTEKTELYDSSTAEETSDGSPVKDYRKSGSSESDDGVKKQRKRLSDILLSLQSKHNNSTDKEPARKKRRLRKRKVKVRYVFDSDEDSEDLEEIQLEDKFEKTKSKEEELKLVVKNERTKPKEISECTSEIMEVSSNIYKLKCGSENPLSKSEADDVIENKKEINYKASYQTLSRQIDDSRLLKKFGLNHCSVRLKRLKLVKGKLHELPDKLEKPRDLANSQSADQIKCGSSILKPAETRQSLRKSMNLKYKTEELEEDMEVEVEANLKGSNAPESSSVKKVISPKSENQSDPFLTTPFNDRSHFPKQNGSGYQPEDKITIHEKNRYSQQENGKEEETALNKARKQLMTSLVGNGSCEDLVSCSTQQLNMLASSVQQLNTTQANDTEGSSFNMFIKRKSKEGWSWKFHTYKLPQNSTVQVKKKPGRPRKCDALEPKDSVGKPHITDTSSLGMKLVKTTSVQSAADITQSSDPNKCDPQYPLTQLLIPNTSTGRVILPKLAEVPYKLSSPVCPSSTSLQHIHQRIGSTPLTISTSATACSTTKLQARNCFINSKSATDSASEKSTSVNLNRQNVNSGKPIFVRTPDKQPTFGSVLHIKEEPVSPDTESQNPFDATSSTNPEKNVSEKDVNPCLGSSVKAVYTAKEFAPMILKHIDGHSKSQREESTTNSSSKFVPKSTEPLSSSQSNVLTSTTVYIKQEPVEDVEQSSILSSWRISASHSAAKRSRDSIVTTAGGQVKTPTVTTVPSTFYNRHVRMPAPEVPSSTITSSLSLKIVSPSVVSLKSQCTLPQQVVFSSADSGISSPSGSQPVVKQTPIILQPSLAGQPVIIHQSQFQQQGTPVILQQQGQQGHVLVQQPSMILPQGSQHPNVLPVMAVSKKNDVPTLASTYQSVPVVSNTQLLQIPQVIMQSSPTTTDTKPALTGDSPVPPQNINIGHQFCIPSYNQSDSQMQGLIVPQGKTAANLNSTNPRIPVSGTSLGIPTQNAQYLQLPQLILPQNAVLPSSGVPAVSSVANILPQQRMGVAGVNMVAGQQSTQTLALLGPGTLGPSQLFVVQSPAGQVLLQGSVGTLPSSK